MDEKHPPSTVWFLRKTPVFAGQTDTMFDSADRRAELIGFRKGDSFPISRDTPYVYLVMLGEMKVAAQLGSGKEAILDVVGSGDLFGPIDSALAEQPTSHQPEATVAIALSDGQLLRYELSWFQELVERRPTISLNLSRLFGLRQKRLEIRLMSILYRTMKGKLAGLLSELARRYGQESKRGVRIRVRLTHREMAGVIGCRRASVSEALAELEYDELIAIEDNHVIVRDLDALDRVP